MPDGFDRRPATGDRPPARRTTTARAYEDDLTEDLPGDLGEDFGEDLTEDQDYDTTGDFDAGPYDDPYQDDYADGTDDEQGHRPGRARRFATWLGLGMNGPGYDRDEDEHGTDDEDDLYIARSAAPPPPNEPPPVPRQSEGGSDPRDSGDTGDAGDTASSGRATAGPRRTRSSSPWEDIMLGSGPPPGTPMSDAIPMGILPPERVPSARGAAVSDWLDPASPTDTMDPMDPVDPLDPRDPVGSSIGADAVEVDAATRKAAEAKTADPRATAVDAPPAPSVPAQKRAVEFTPTAAVPAAAGAAEPTPQVADFPAESPEPRRMLRLLPTPVLADGGGMVVDGGRVGRLTVRAAAVRGGLHAEQGTPRQNSFAVGPDPTGRWTITIVCDGIDGGYAPELAAQVAVRSTYRAVARMVGSGRHEDWDWTTTLASVQNDLRTRLGDIGAKARELGRPAPATRLAILVTSAEPLVDDRIDIAVLGDSTILRLAEGGWRAPLGIRETPTDTPPALPEHGTEHARTCRTTWRPSDALVVMTGGFAESLGADSGGLAARLAGDWRRPPELLTFLGDVAQGSQSDDTAVVALWPEP